MNNIYEDIAKRTQGDIYIGVVGPVRTGKSTFIRRFMETLVLPNIENDFKRERTKDEIPQSGSGRTIMTVEPKFVPADGVEIKIKDTVSLKVRMVDCVGYIVDGALGHEEDGKQRLVSTPWSKEAMTFEKAAEIGTKKVIKDHSTIGIVIITDGSVTGIERSSYIIPEERVIKELKSLKKPFAVVLNTKHPNSEDTKFLRKDLEEKYDVPIIPMDVDKMDEEDIEEVMETVLYDFPLGEIRINLPDWVEGLANNHWIKTNIINTLIYDICSNSSPENGLRFSDENLKLLNDIKKFNYEHIYFNKHLQYPFDYFRLVINQIFNVLAECYDNENTLEKLNSIKVFYPVLISSFVDWIKKYWNLTDRSNSNLKNKVIFDMSVSTDFYKAIIYYISGMTDNFAISCYNEIIGF